MRPNFRYIVGTNDDGTSVSADSIDVTATDDYTVVIVLKEPTSAETFFSIASSMILPKHLLENEDPSTMAANAFWQNPVGSGPLKFESMVDGERIEYTANKDYHLGAPQMDRFVMRIVPQSSLLAGLMSGDIDILAGGELGLLSMDDYELAMDDANLVTEALGSFSHTYISIDNSNPMMSKEVRLAIDRAIDKQRIVDELLGGFGQVTVTPWAPSHPFFNPALELNNYDPEEAKALLEAAGWDSSVQLTMGISSTDQFAQNVAALIQQDLAAVGLDVKIQQYDLAAQFEAILDGSIELAITGSAASVEPNNPVVNLFDIYGAWCFGRFTDDTYLQYFNEGLKYHETEKRLPIYYELQALMAEEMPYVYLACPDVLFAYNKKLGNVNGFNFTNYIPVWEWTVAQ
jgi:peptide/nickel transport system substrate-binding protein